jgi:hypothetical protein
MCTLFLKIEKQHGYGLPPPHPPDLAPHDFFSLSETKIETQGEGIQ